MSQHSKNSSLGISEEIEMLARKAHSLLRDWEDVQLWFPDWIGLEKKKEKASLLKLKIKATVKNFLFQNEMP